MAVLANLSVGLSVDSARLSKGLKKAGKKVKRFSKKASKQLKSAGKVMAAAFAGAAYAAANLAKQMDDIIKKAQSLGVGSAELQGLTYAWGQMGISADVAGKAVFNFQKSMGEAKKGLATYTDDLDTLGLTYEDLAGLTPIEQMNLFIDRLSKVEDVNVRNAIAARFFGRAAKDLGPILNGGSEAFAFFIKKAKQFGIVINEGALKSAEKFNDALDTLWLTLRGAVANALGSTFEALAPLIEGFALFAMKIMPQLGVIIPVVAKALVALAAALALVWVAALGPIGLGIIAVLATVTAGLAVIR